MTYVTRRRILRGCVALAVGWFSLNQVPPVVAGFRTKATPARERCLVLTSLTGDRYSLSYGDHSCFLGDGPPLPKRMYDSVEAWTFNANFVRVIPALDTYRVYARLASKDTRIHAPYLWSPHGGTDFQPSFQWAHDAQYAYFAAYEAPRNPGRAQEHLGRYLVQAGLADYEGGDLKVRERMRWPWVEDTLVKILAQAEDHFSSDSAMIKAHNEVNTDNPYARRNLLTFHVELGF